MSRWVTCLMCCVNAVLSGKDTDEEFEDFMRKARTTLRPMSYRERELNKMVEDNIVRFNEAVTESDSTDKEGPSWWEAYRLAMYGEQLNGRDNEVHPHYTSTPTWKPGTPVINIRLKTEPTIQWLT
ncbi:uncharacterized protein LOC129004985 [Macrosteles quadrilineatus]|uniref:uncharacterized protein LOC129004985 n=1 Tax=Macrosteles quadrilineatus TaxID=74068 RepID=UPI0023E34980|nr:uncharacterized protein LOC129004985 [Macrosteles quadrilineatus]